MRLTTKGRYAVTAMLDLALHNEKGPVSLGEISKRQSISLSYLEQLFALLKRKGLIVSTRGPGGGYSLNKKASAIDIADVIDAVDEPVDTRCHDTKSTSCNHRNRCLTHDLWCNLSAQIHGFLAGISLADLMKSKEIRAVASRQDQMQEKAVHFLPG
jgi:Rrf2 family iron-sulfur cluster assembly transcriptional regulator